MTDDLKELTDELVALRHGPGLTVQSVAQSMRVLEALGNPPPREALRRLEALVRQLGDSEPALVLRRAYAIDVSPPGSLARRQEAYRRETGRDKKTILRYEMKMVGELAALLSRGVAQRERLMIGAWVKGRRLDYARVEFADELVIEPPGVQMAYRPAVTYESLPVFLYRLPDHYAPEHMVVTILFPEDDQPSEVWGIHTPDLFEVPVVRYERRIIHDEQSGWRYLDYDRPTVGYYYGFGWRY